MGKVIAWLVLIFLVLLALRVMARRSGRARQEGGAIPAAQPMVRCERCGVYLPRAEAKQTGSVYVCATGDCVPHG
jgi:uncharacterized protein